MNPEASTNPESKAGNTTPPENIDHLIEAVREAFRALPPKYRASIFKKADHGSSATLRKLLQAAHIPATLQPARIGHWLTTDQQHKLETLILSSEHSAWLESLLRGFFCNGHKSLNELLLKSIDPKGPEPKSMAEALVFVGGQFSQDPYIELYTAAMRWVCREILSAKQGLTASDGDVAAAQANSPDKQSATAPGAANPSPETAAASPSNNFTELDVDLQVVSGAVVKLEGMQPVPDVATAISALQRAHDLSTSLTNELKTLAAEAGEPEPQWSSRAEFIALRERVAALASGRTKMFQRAAVLVAELAKMFSGVVVRHRLPSRSVVLTELAHSAATEITEHGTDLATILLSQSGSAKDWLKWLWQQEGEAAENAQQKLRPLSPAFANLLVDADWRDLQWPESSPEVSVPAAVSPDNKPEPSATSLPLPPTTDFATPEPVKFSTISIPELVNVKIATGPEPAAPALVKIPAVVTPCNSPAISNPMSLEPEPTSPLTSERSRAPEPAEPRTEAAIATDVVTLAIPPAQSTALITALWRLASANRWGLASHLAALNTNASSPPSWVFEAAALSPRLNYEVSPISECLTEIFARSAEFRTESLQPDVSVVTRILLAAVALRPALLAPQTNAASILKLSELMVVPKLQSLGHFVEAVAEFGLHQQALQPEMLLSSHNVEDWERQLARVRAEINQWIVEAPLRGFNYALAARIWRKWTGVNGPLSQLLRETAEMDTKHLNRVRAKWETWSTNAAELVQSGIREFNHRKSMDGAARDKLIAQIGEAVQLADRVFALQSQVPQAGATFRTEQVHQLLAARQRHLGPARQELKNLQSAFPDEATIAAVRLCDTALEQVEYLLQGHLPLPGGDEPNPRWILDAELLRDPVFPVCSDGTQLPPDQSNLAPLLAIAQTNPDWKDSWARQIKAENHLGTAALLEFFRWQLPPGLDITELEHQRTLDLESCRHRLEKESSDTRRLLDEFASLGLCRELDYDTWTAEVGNVEQAIGSAMSFAPLSERLAKVRANVQLQRDTEVLRVRQRLDANQAVQSADRNRIAALLDSGDIHTAIDYLDLVAQKLPLPESGTPPSIFMAFFGADGWLRKAEASLRDANFNECWQAAREGGVWNGLDFQFLGTDQRTSTVLQLQLWQNIERKRLVSVDEVSKLASYLGLQPIKVTARTSRATAHLVQAFDIKAQVIAERAAAIVPAFGSDANGRYTLHLVWGEPDAEELLSLCGRETGDTSAHILVVFRLLSTKGRYELAEEARKPERAFKGVVVDRALFAFICAQPTARYSTLLRCALPFSCVEPYSIAAGEVPPEMFFGRGRELQSLADPRGSCFVYGGRQLGKTALLRALERRFHNLEQGRAAIFVDLKRELFSRGRGINALWSVLVARLKEVGVLNESKVGAAAGQEALFRHIEEWLKASPDRRLLLLLDEADTFLEEDGKESDHYEPFPRCQRLKGLMDDTGRRFKVVLAGLHNVQRTTRSVNHPLAHFGEAICIGPMLEEAESREARALVEQPLAAAGYFFESPEVVSRILALTNYYPSLIQIFCHHLLVDLRANHVARFQTPRSTPPCTVTSQHVQTAYGSRVREAIHIKVGLTLDLDKRYKLIARLLAFYHANQPGDDGVALRDIRSDAANYWPGGFADMRTDDEFHCLLDEMVGLGILRPIPNSSRFALRNQNVTTLLGTPEEIARQIDEAKDWEPAQKYEANKFRRLLAEKPKLIFSPLTVQQESELKAPENRVAILYGLPAAGLSQVPLAMLSDSLFGKSRTTSLRECSDATNLADRIARLDRDPQSNTIIIVPPGLPWDETWVAAARARIGTFTSKDAFLTVLFIADPHRTAATIQGLEGARDLGVREITLRPWHDAAVRQWLDELGVGGDNDVRKLIHQATGNWPELLMRLNVSSSKDLPLACADLAQLLRQPGQLPDLHSAFGFGEESADQPLRIAAQLKQFTVEDVCDYSELPDAAGRQRVAECIARAERLGLISIAGNKLEFDPVAAMVLLKTSAPA